jgi:RNA polymerase sigma-70 factor (ECF subfamily)
MQESSHQAFEKLFRLHNYELCNLAYNLLRDRDSAKDVVQEVFLKLWKNKDTVVLGDQIKHYLFRATAHTAMNHIRFNKKITRLDDHEALMNVAAYADRHELGFKELELRVRESIDRLPSKCKAIYILSRQEGLKYQEIADTLNLSVKTVENQMGIALEKLRNDLKPFLSPEFLTIAILIALLFSLFS